MPQRTKRNIRDFNPSFQITKKQLQADINIRANIKYVTEEENRRKSSWYKII